MVKEKNGKKYSIKVITSSDQKRFISVQDDEMDKRAEKAVEAAVEKAVICRKPVAKYDKVSKKAYLEYSDGEKKYVD